jgi:hypothetical protein
MGMEILEYLIIGLAAGFALIFLSKWGLQGLLHRDVDVYQEKKIKGDEFDV